MIYTYGRDLKHRPIIIMNLSLVDFDRYTVEEYYSAINACIQTVIDHMFVPGRLEKYLYIIDMGNKSITSMPFDKLVAIITKLSVVYSLRLGAMAILNTNYLFKLSYIALKPFISEETKNKITILTSS